MSETTLNLEHQRDNAKELIERRDLALRLYKNPDFKKLILEDFCVQECARYAQASADPALNAEARADSLAIAQSAGHLRRFLSVIVQMGNQAENQMADLNEAIEASRQEDDLAE